MHEAQIAMFEGLPTHDGNVKALQQAKRLSRTLTVPPNYTLVQSDAELERCVELCKEYGVFAFDTETNGVGWAHRAVGFSIACGPTDARQAFFVPTAMLYLQRNFTHAEVRDSVSDLFSSSTIKKAAFNMKFDMHKMAQTYGVDIFNNMYHDALIAQWLLNENEPHDLESICSKWLGTKRWKITNDGKFHIWPSNVATYYACSDAEETLKLFDFQVPHLEELADIHSLMYDVEMPHLMELYAMERQGIAWDEAYYRNTMLPEIMDSLHVAEAACREFFGNCNLNSPQQVAAILYDGLNLPQLDGRSVAKPVLLQLRYDHPAVDALLTYGKYETARANFADALPQFVDKGRIHCNLAGIGARTGRLACRTPNLQNLPKQSLGPIIRRAFVPTPGFVFVTIDFSQIELRLLAHWSQDEALLDAFRTGKDIHAVTMARISDYTLDDITKDKNSAAPSHELAALRVRAKTINFGILYGMGPNKLMNTINAIAKRAEDMITLKQAQELIDLWYDAYPAVMRYKTKQERYARKHGYVLTLLGRKRRLPNVRHADRKQSSAAERQAVNAPIQGSAADIMKKATIAVAQLIRANHWPYRLLLQVHDELIMEVPLEWIHSNKQSLECIKEAFVGAVPLSVPVIADPELLSRWGDKFVDDEIDLDLEEA